MKNRIIVIISALMIVNTNCTAQTPSFGERPLQFDDFDFNLNIHEYYPEKYKWEEFENFYRIPLDPSHPILIEKEIVREFGYPPESQPPVWIEYRQQGWSSADKLATLGRYTFYSINIVTTLDDDVILVNGFSAKIEVQEFVDSLTEKYGQCTFEKVKDMHSYIDTYTWKLADRTIRYCVRFTDEKDTIKLGFDKKNGTIEEVKRKPHDESYLYIIKKGYEDQLIGNMRRGALVYCKRNYRR